LLRHPWILLIKGWKKGLWSWAATLLNYIFTDATLTQLGKKTFSLIFSLQPWINPHPLSCPSIVAIHAISFAGPININEPVQREAARCPALEDEALIARGSEVSECVVKHMLVLGARARRVSPLSAKVTKECIAEL
jgi:hypothetical protein